MNTRLTDEEIRLNQIEGWCNYRLASQTHVVDHAWYLDIRRLVSEARMLLSLRAQVEFAEGQAITSSNMKLYNMLTEGAHPNALASAASDLRTAIKAVCKHGQDAEARCEALLKRLERLQATVDHHCRQAYSQAKAARPQSVEATGSDGAYAALNSLRADLLPDLLGPGEERAALNQGKE